MSPDIVYSLEMTFRKLWIDVMQFLPELLLAIIVIILGTIIGGVLKSIVERVFKTLKVDHALGVAGVDQLAERAGYTLQSGVFVGSLVKWFVIVVFFVVALDILHLDAVTVFFRDVVLGYLPHVIVAVLILLIAAAVAHVAKNSVTAAARASGFSAADMLGSVAWYAIVVFAVLAALNQLSVAPQLMQTLFMGIVFGAALAFGLAFGLGGKEVAADYLKSLRQSGGHHDHN